MKQLILILGDQLSLTISSLQQCDKQRDIILMCEVVDEATYVKHHKKKIAFIFSAMRHFALDLKSHDYSVNYIKLDDRENTQSFAGEVKRAIARHSIDRIVVTFPGEYRVLESIKSWQKNFNIPVEILADHRFLCATEEFEKWVDNRKQLRMEYFYRVMRLKHNILLDSKKQPLGERWNFDSENRKSPPETLMPPDTFRQIPDDMTLEVIKLVKDRFATHFGDLEPFHYAVTRQQALAAFDKFIKERLAQFGDYQDAMLVDQPWMYHSHIGLYLNCGLLEPLECIRKAEQAYHENHAPLAAVEGFIRQIAGWREYVRGIYWLKMPDYLNVNFLNATLPLPEFYWTANTEMNCLKQCVTDTKKHAYAHHIQRLMVLGNFLLLIGVDPKAVNEWYLLVYADAYEWVELPNVSGMILFADGGYLASKPYAASGNYIKKMSNYCKNCQYDVKQKLGDQACPFNYLYWNFIGTHGDKFESNPRMRMIYEAWRKMDGDQRELIKQDSKKFLK